MVTDTTSMDEEQCIEDLFVWHCYKDNLTTFKQYKTLQQMCSAEGIPEQVVTDAIEHHAGNWGAYHFVRRVGVVDFIVPNV